MTTTQTAWLSDNGITVAQYPDGITVFRGRRYEAVVFASWPNDIRVADLTQPDENAELAGMFATAAYVSSLHDALAMVRRQA